MASCFRLISHNASKSSSRLSSFRSNFGRRHLHQVKELPYSIEEGLGRFLPPPALKTMMEYQEGLLNRLNEEVRNDTSIELHENVTGLVEKYASRRERTLGFNYAVLALNNSFFLEQLTPPPPEDSGVKSHQGFISEQLFDKIRNQYGDLIGLKSAFSASAMGMFSNGWVWMVTDRDGNLGVIPTLGPSTLLVRSRRNMHYAPGLIIGEQASGPKLLGNSPIRPIPQPPTNPKTLPGVTPSLPTSGVSGSAPTRGLFDDHTRAFHSTRAEHSEPDFGIGNINSIHNKERPKESEVQGKTTSSALHVGRVLYPLFCIPVYEHAWMSAGFGVWGKEAWLTEFWTVLDWKKVSKAYRIARESVTDL